MAFVPMTAGGGGSMTETTLWTNSSPSASFAAQTITLSDNISNYDYIRIKYRYNNTTPTDSYAMTDVTSLQSMTGTGTMTLALGLQHTNGINYARNCLYVSDTELKFTLAWYGNNSTSALVSIPGEIIGVKL